MAQFLGMIDQSYLESSHIHSRCPLALKTFSLEWFHNMSPCQSSLLIKDQEVLEPGIEELILKPKGLLQQLASPKEVKSTCLMLPNVWLYLGLGIGIND
jgi:hypothetical protein